MKVNLRKPFADVAAHKVLEGILVRYAHDDVPLLQRTGRITRRDVLGVYFRNVQGGEWIIKEGVELEAILAPGNPGMVLEGEDFEAALMLMQHALAQLQLGLPLCWRGLDMSSHGVW